jgi:hypothetical protein
LRRWASFLPAWRWCINTPSTDAAAPHSCNQYDVSLILPVHDGPVLVLEALPILEGAFRHEGIDGLLGRDARRRLYAALGKARKDARDTKR